MGVRATADQARFRFSLLLGGLTAALLAFGASFAAEAGAKVVPYKAVEARLQIVNAGTATLSDGSTWEGESTAVATGVQSANAALIAGTAFMTMSAESTYTQTGFEIKTNPTGVTDGCSGPIEAIFLPIYPIIADIKKQKKGFTVEWRIHVEQISDDCGVSYSSYLPQGYVDREKEKEKLGDKTLVLDVAGSDTFTGDAVGVPFTHTTTWSGRVVLKRGGAVAGRGAGHANEGEME